MTSGTFVFWGTNRETWNYNTLKQNHDIVLQVLASAYACYSKYTIISHKAGERLVGLCW